MKQRIEVVGAVIAERGRILCTRRGPGSLEGYWEFPGGKVESGELPEEALAREILEELGCTVEVGSEVATTTHEYDFATIVLTTFYCRLVAGEPRLSEHSDSRWLPPGDLPTLDWAPADVPTVRQIQNDLA